MKNAIIATNVILLIFNTCPSGFYNTLKAKATVKLIIDGWLVTFEFGALFDPLAEKYRL